MNAYKKRQLTFRVLLRCFLIAAYITCSGTAVSETLTGKVIAVTDGDTITVLDADREQHKIRLMGIDAPEKNQPFGQRSKQNLSRLVFSREALVDWEKRDRFGRIVGKVLVQPQGCRLCSMTLDVGHAQISVGLAWWYRKYSKEQSDQDAAAYEFSEQEAKTRRIGLWVDPAAIPPWEFRKTR